MVEEQHRGSILALVRRDDGVLVLVADRLEQVECTNPAGERFRVFEAVHRPEELYGCSREGRDWLPDLILSPST